MKKQYGIQVRTDYFLNRTDSLPVPNKNKTLFDAAPDLLEALKKALRNMPNGPSFLRWEIEAAIAKAEGQS